jgi:hypothetical protein
MLALRQVRTARKQKAGRLLLAIGAAAFFLQLWALGLEAGAAWSRGASESLGWMGALGMAALQVVDFIAWNPNGILLSLTNVLLLCWPVAIMVAGVVISRKRIELVRSSRIAEFRGTQLNHPRQANR